MKKNRGNLLTKVISCLMAIFVLVYSTVDSHVYAFVRSDQHRLKGIYQDNFQIPWHLGSVSRSYEGDSRTMVFHIQDAHCHYEAQRSIANLLRYLFAEYGEMPVNLEGGEGGYDLSVLREVDDHSARERVTEYFMKKGILSGPESFAINAPEDVTLWGVEEAGLYLENLNAYRNSQDDIQKGRVIVNTINSIFDSIGDSILNERLSGLWDQIALFRSGRIDIKEHCVYLADRARESGIVMREFPELSSFLRVLSLEEDIDFRTASDQRTYIVGVLRDRLSGKELEELAFLTLGVKDRTAPAGKLYDFIRQKSAALKVPLSGYSELQKYMRYLAAYKKIDKRGMIKEISRIQEKIWMSFADTPESGEFYPLMKRLRLIEKQFDIALTREEYESWRNRPELFLSRNYADYIADVTEDSAPPNIRGLDFYRRKIGIFYELSFERDEVFLHNLLFGDIKGGKKAAILVTGGFHTENLCDLMEKRGISYISIAPKFNNAGRRKNPYHSLLAGRQSEVVKTLKKEFSTISLYSDFCANTPYVYGRDTYRARRLWMELAAAIFAGRRDVTVEGRRYTFEKVPGAEAVEGVIIQGRQVYAAGRSGDSRGAESDIIVAIQEGDPGGYVIGDGRGRGPISPAVSSPDSVKAAAGAFIGAVAVLHLGFGSRGWLFAGWLIAAGILMVYQARQSVRIAGWDGYATTPEYKFSRIIEIFGPFLGPAVWIHERVHDVTKFLGMRSGGTADEFLAYCVNVIVYPLTVMIMSPVTYFARSVVAAEETLEGLDSLPSIKAPRERNGSGGGVVVSSSDDGLDPTPFPGVAMEALEQLRDPDQDVPRAIPIDDSGIVLPATEVMEAAGGNTGKGPISGARSFAGDLYAAAAEALKSIVPELRRGSPGFCLAPTSYEDYSADTRSSRRVARVFGGEGHDVTARHYTFDPARPDKWFEEMTGENGVLDNLLERFSASALADARSRMVIRLLNVNGQSRRTELEDHIASELCTLNASGEHPDGDPEKVEMIFSRIKIMEVDLGDVRHLNPVTDIVTDMALMEMDRYRAEEYTDAPPDSLVDSLERMLSLASDNIGVLIFRYGIEAVVRRLFTGEYVLRLAPIDWEDMKERFQAENEVLKSL